MHAKLDERARRLWAARQAEAYGRGGINAVRRATGLAYETVARGLAELRAGTSLPPGRVRRAGAGRKKRAPVDDPWKRELEALIGPSTGLDADFPLRWTSKSMRQLANELRKAGHDRCDTTVRGLLHARGYGLRSRRRSKEGAPRPDPDAQFEHVNRRVQRQRAAGGPAITIDTKRREWAQLVRRTGREWRVERERLPAHVRDFLATEGGPMAPDQGFELARRACWENAGIAPDTAAFAAATIGRWWELAGKAAYPGATTLLVVIDDDGGDGPLVRRWQGEVQTLADATGLAVTVCHLPPGTSRWNRIEPRLFRFTAGMIDDRRTLASAAIVREISPPPSTAEPPARCEIDEGREPLGTYRTDYKLQDVRIEYDARPRRLELHRPPEVIAVVRPNFSREREIRRPNRSAADEGASVGPFVPATTRDLAT